MLLNDSVCDDAGAPSHAISLRACDDRRVLRWAIGTQRNAGRVYPRAPTCRAAERTTASASAGIPARQQNAETTRATPAAETPRRNPSAAMLKATTLRRPMMTSLQAAHAAYARREACPAASPAPMAGGGTSGN